MPFRRGTPGGVIPSPTGGGLTGAVAGFAEMREMARQARLDQERHDLQMRMFNEQLKANEMGQLGAQIDLLSRVAQPGQALGELAPNIVPELSAALGVDPEQLGQTVLSPFGPEHVMGQGAAAFLEQATPEQLARVGEIASTSGRTMEEITASATQGQFAELITSIQTDWVRNNPELFTEAIAQELGPNQMYDIDVFGHNIELTGQNAAEILVRMQQLIDARSIGNIDAAADARAELIDWGRSTAEDLGLTGMVGPINEMVNLMTDPDLTPGEYIQRVDRMKARSPEIKLLVEALEDGRAVGSSALMNMYRDDPRVAPILGMMEFAQELEIFPADERVQILNSLGAVLDGMGLAHLKTGFMRSTRVVGPEGAADPIQQISQRFGGLSQRQVEGAISVVQQETGWTREQAIQQILTGDVDEMRPATGPPVSDSPPPQTDLLSRAGAHTSGEPPTNDPGLEGLAPRDRFIVTNTRPLLERERIKLTNHERGVIESGADPNSPHVRRARERIENEIMRLEALIEKAMSGGG